MGKNQLATFFDYIDYSVKINSLPTSNSLNEVKSLNKIFKERFTPFNYAKPLIYLLDYSTGKYLFVSENSQIQVSPKKIKEGGIEFLTESYHPQDLEIFSKQIFKDRQIFLKDIPIAERRNILFSYNYRFRNSKGEYINIFSQNINIQTNEKGFPILSMGVVISTNSFEHSDPIIHLIERTDERNANREILQKKSYYLREEYQIFSKREIEILLHIADGLTSKQIAVKLYISEHTVINHKRNMHHKSNTQNTAALIGFAFKNRIL